MPLPTYDSHPTWRRYQPYFPDGMARQDFYQPRGRGFAREIGKRMEYWAKLRNSR